MDETLLDEKIQTFAHGHQGKQRKVYQLLLVYKGVPFDDVEEEEAIDRQLFSSFFIKFSKKLNDVFLIFSSRTFNLYYNIYTVFSWRFSFWSYFIDWLKVVPRRDLFLMIQIIFLDLGIFLCPNLFPLAAILGTGSAHRY